MAAALGMVRSSLAELGRQLPGHHGVAAKHSFAKLWCSNNKPWSCSLFTIGRTLLDRLKLNLPRAMNQLRREVLTQNWG